VIVVAAVAKNLLCPFSSYGRKEGKEGTEGPHLHDQRFWESFD
jgi:hypothetical protein